MEQFEDIKLSWNVQRVTTDVSTLSNDVL